MKPPTPTEASDQIAIFDLIYRLQDRYPVLRRVYSVPNQLDVNTRKRNPKTGAWYSTAGDKRKAMGLRPGIPDIIVDVPVYPYHGLRIELKRQGVNKRDPDQEDWRIWYENNGFVYAWVNTGPQNAWEVLREYLMPIVELPKWE